MIAHRRGQRVRGRIGRVGAVTACIVVAAAFIPACSSDQSSEQAATESASSIEASPTGGTPDARLYGTWDVGNDQSYQTFEPDGTWYVELATKMRLDDGTPVVLHARQPYDWGTYTFDGAKLTLDTPADAQTCPNTSGVYTVTFVDANTLRYELVEDACDSRRVTITAEQHTRIEARSRQR